MFSHQTFSQNLTIFYTCGFGKVFFTCDGSLTTQVSPLPFNIENLTILKLSSNRVKVLLPYRGGGGGGLPVVGCGGSLMTHSCGSVTPQSIAFKYVKAPESYRYI
jgi:hypothetical protein